MSKKSSPAMPTVEQVEAELKRYNRKKRNKGATRAELPDFSQVAMERERLQKNAAPKKISNKSETQAAASRKKKPVYRPSMEEVSQEREHLRYTLRFRNVFANTLGILIVVAAAAALIATLCLSILQVSGTSMEPTLNDGDIIVLIKNDDFQTGDLVGLYYNGKVMLKRVIGQAGDYINIDTEGNVYVNGECIDEPYLTAKSLGECDISFPYQVPDSSCFVLGDHRSISTDSRNSAIGCIKTDQIIGKIVLRIWPLPDISFIK